MKLLQLDEHSLSDCGDDTARIASDVHLLVVAMQTEYDLPSFAKAWLARWVNFRAEDLDGALVALVTNDVVAPDSDSGLIAHLETVAFVGRLAFFYGGVRTNGESFKADSSTHPSLGRRRRSDRRLQPEGRCGGRLLAKAALLMSVVSVALTAPANSCPRSHPSSSSD